MLPLLRCVILESLESFVKIDFAYKLDPISNIGFTWNLRDSLNIVHSGRSTTSPSFSSVSNATSLSRLIIWESMQKHWYPNKNLPVFYYLFLGRCNSTRFHSIEISKMSFSSDRATPVAIIIRSNTSKQVFFFKYYFQHLWKHQIYINAENRISHGSLRS